LRTRRRTQQEQHESGSLHARFDSPNPP
jgi:hypothetical protein